MERRRILLIESDADLAKKLAEDLARIDFETVHVEAELAAVTELTGSFYELIIVGLRDERRRGGIRLLEVLTEQLKVVAPIMVLSDIQGPQIVKKCVAMKVADYVLYAQDDLDVLVRVEKTLETSGGLGEMLVKVATTFLGPAARVFLEMQTKAKLSLKSLQELRREHLPEFIHHLHEVVQPVLKEKVVLFRRRLEQVFHIQPGS